MTLFGRCLHRSDVTRTDPTRSATRSPVWKLEGLSDYDIRRPLVPSGTNLLGLIKHLASVELGYFGDTFWRPFDEPLPWLDEGAAPNADMWATAAESRQEIIGLYQRVWHHADITIGSLALDSVTRVPWWPPDRSEVTLHRFGGANERKVGAVRLALFTTR